MSIPTTIRKFRTMFLHASLQCYIKCTLHVYRYRSSHSQLFFKIGFLKNFAIFTGKHLLYCEIFKISCSYIAPLVAVSANKTFRITYVQCPGWNILQQGPDFLWSKITSKKSGERGVWVVFSLLQSINTYSKSAIETLEKVVKYDINNGLLVVYY